MQYSLKIADRQERDLLLGAEDSPVFLDRDSAPFLDDCTLDYRDSLHDAGFTLLNPRAVRSCGCGSSFEPAPGSPDAASLPANDSPDQTCTPEADPSSSRAS